MIWVYRLLALIGAGTAVVFLYLVAVEVFQKAKNSRFACALGFHSYGGVVTFTYCEGKVANRVLQWKQTCRHCGHYKYLPGSPLIEFDGIHHIPFDEVTDNLQEDYPHEWRRREYAKKQQERWQRRLHGEDDEVKQ